MQECKNRSFCTGKRSNKSLLVKFTTIRFKFPQMFIILAVTFISKNVSHPVLVVIAFLLQLFLIILAVAANKSIFSSIFILSASAFSVFLVLIFSVMFNDFLMEIRHFKILCKQKVRNFP